MANKIEFNRKLDALLKELSENSAQLEKSITIPPEIQLGILRNLKNSASTLERIRSSIGDGPVTMDSVLKALSGAGTEGEVIINNMPSSPNPTGQVKSATEMAKMNPENLESKSKSEFFFGIMTPVAVAAGYAMMDKYQKVAPNDPMKIAAIIFATFGCLSTLLGGLVAAQARRDPGPGPALIENLMYVATGSVAYGFIGTMCHSFLRENPILMYTVAILAIALITATLAFVRMKA